LGSYSEAYSSFYQAKVVVDERMDIETPSEELEKAFAVAAVAVTFSAFYFNIMERNIKVI
jgi:hypothetical protein